MMFCFFQVNCMASTYTEKNCFLEGTNIPNSEFFLTMLQRKFPELYSIIVMPRVTAKILHKRKDSVFFPVQ